MKNKRLIKLIILIPLLFSLTGCGWWGYNSGGMLNSNINETIGTFVIEMQLSFFWGINYIFLRTQNILTYIFKQGPGTVISVLYQFFSEFSFIGTIITIVSLISVGAILVRFAYTVFKTYFLNVDGQHAAPTMDFFKRIMYSLIIVALAPQLMITAFVGSNLLGAVGGTAIITGSQTEDIGILVDFVEDSEKYGIQLSTYCYDGLLNDGTSSGVSKLKNDPASITMKVVSSAHSSQVGDTYLTSIFKNRGEADPIKSLSDKWCVPVNGVYPRRVGEYLIVLNKDARVQWPYAQFGGTDLKDFDDSAVDAVVDAATAPIDLVTLLVGGWVGTLISTLVSIVFLIAALLMTAFRLADLVSSIIMLWFYVSSYISEVKNNQIGEFIKQVAAICITQMYTIFIFSIYISYYLTAGSGLIQAIMGFALLCLMWKGGNTVKNALSSSGAASGTGAVAGLATKAISKF